MDLTEAIDRFRGPLVGLIASWGAPYVDASELAQESLADGYMKRDRCRGDCCEPEVFGRWLRGVARNKFRNWRRSRHRRESKVTLIDHAILEQTTAINERPDVDPRLVELRLAIERLPIKQRQVILMHYIDETSINDVAALLSVTPKAVEGRLFQARRALKRMLDNPNAPSIAQALML